MSHHRELNIAVSQNLKYKSGILAVIFGMIFLLQIGMMLFSDLFEKVVADFGGRKIFILGPSFLLLAAACEAYSYYYIGKIVKRGGHITQRLVLAVTFIEISFPTFILVIVFSFIKGSAELGPIQALNSPPVMMYFLLIMLSALSLDYRISLFAGAVAAIEFFFISWCFTKDLTDVSHLEILNNNVKAIFLFVSAVIAGFVSFKTRTAVIASLHSKDMLINKLDHLVNEKTEEIRQQKDELEQKNKDITDSINYARRIQHSQMPTEKYLVRTLSRLITK
jgi:adenylate cyclase